MQKYTFVLEYQYNMQTNKTIPFKIISCLLAMILVLTFFTTYSQSVTRKITVKEYIETLENLKIDSRFMEFEQEAKLAKLETLEVLRKALTDREKYEAEQALIREQQLKEQAEQQARQAEIDKALAIERAEQAAKQAEHNKQLAIQAERERIEREVREKEEAERKEQERREADKAHKKQVCDAILAELAKINIDEKIGKDLIRAIYNNQIPNIKITF